MKLQEIFNQLSQGELSQLFYGAEGLQGINADNLQRVGHAINTGLTALHTRFFLREERLRINLIPDRTSYPIAERYAEDARGTTETDRYIEGSYTGNLLKIEQVFTDSGYELGLNDRDDPHSVLTPSMNILSVPRILTEKRSDLPDYLKTDSLLVVYRANHPILNEDLGLDDAEEYEVELPYSHLQALLYFVASRLHNPVGMTNQFHMGNSYAQKYELECQRLEMDNLQIDRGVTNTRAERMGWV